MSNDKGMTKFECRVPVMRTRMRQSFRSSPQDELTVATLRKSLLLQRRLTSDLLSFWILLHIWRTNFRLRLGHTKFIRLPRVALAEAGG
jgi:hypothetical protein